MNLSDISRQLNNPRSVTHSLDPVIHEVRHYKQVNYLRCHKPVAHILGQKAHRLFSVQLSVCEYPKGDK